MKRILEVKSFFDKLKGVADFIVFACNSVDVLIETDKWVQMKENMNQKIHTLKKNILTDNFGFLFKDIKTKLASIMNYFEDFIRNGEDGLEVTR